MLLHHDAFPDLHPTTATNPESHVHAGVLRVGTDVNKKRCQKLQGNNDHMHDNDDATKGT